jgi:hypothetical protein
MSLERNPDLVPIFSDAAVFVAKGANPVRPAAITDPMGATWDNAGILSGDAGITNPREWDETEHFGWGIGLYRIGRKNYKESRVFTCLENNPTTRKIAHPGSTATAIVVPKPHKAYVCFEFLDDFGRLERWFTERMCDLWIPGLDRNESDPNEKEVTARIFARGDGLLYVRQYTPVNEDQLVTITGTPTGGTFTLSYGGVPTSALAYNAASAAVQAALVALSTIGSGNATVSGSAGGPYSIALVGDLAGQENELLDADGSSLTGGTSPDVVVAAA